jgi:hypothetical protein
MKVILLKREDFKSSKTGMEYTRVPFISIEGLTGEVFTEKSKYDAFDVPSTSYEGVELAKAIQGSDLKVADVNFDQKGRVVSVAVEE